jgi:hypothetical protein
MKKLLLIVAITFATTSIAKQNSGPEVTTFNHSAWNDLLKANVSNAGNVNYKGMKKSQTKLDSYLNELSSTTVDEKLWSKDEQLAFWINVYNAFTVKLIVNNYPTKSINNITKPWDTKFFKIGGVQMNLSHVENEILRKKFNEPRIHFAIVCASYSCPKLSNKAFTAANTQSQLTTLTKGFINDPKRNKISASKVQLSEIFNWYKGDFIKNGTLIAYLNKYLTVKIKANAKVSFLPYNWNLNE